MTCKNYRDVTRIVQRPDGTLDIFYNDGRRQHENMTCFLTMLIKDIQSLSQKVDELTGASAQVLHDPLDRNAPAILKKPEDKVYKKNVVNDVINAMMGEERVQNHYLNDVD